MVSAIAAAPYRPAWFPCMQKPEQVISLAQVELEGMPESEPLIVIGTKRVE